MRRTSLIAVLLCSLYTLPAEADTITVNLNGGADYTAIAEAVAAAEEGDIVLVHPGYYEGPENSSIDFDGKHLELRSVDGYGSTVINGYMFSNVFKLEHGAEATIEGFTVGETSALALMCNLSDVTVRGCRFTGMTAYAGDPIWAQGTVVGRANGGSLLLEDCIFDDNWCRSVGSTITANDCDVTVRNCVFQGNDEGSSNIYNVASGTLVIGGTCSATLEGCSFIDNEVEDCVLSIRGNATVNITYCTFAGNTPVWSHTATEGLLHMSGVNSATVRLCSFVGNEMLTSCITLSDVADVLIDKCTLADNTGGEGAISVAQSPRTGASLTSCVLAFNDCTVPIACAGTLPTISSCCFYESGDPAAMCEPYDPETLVLEDPLFCSLYAGDFTLCLNSPCLVPNNDWGVQIGAFGWGCDACDSPVERASWGSIKAMFR
ncbi:MAG: right-handed parallel beta-helix repeat-containing protein [Candidatus Eisenbacteria bacterium]